MPKPPRPAGSSRSGPAWGALLGFALALVGWFAHSDLLALGGLAFGAATLALRFWQVHCLDAVSYRRVLGADRVSFGEEVSLETSVVNDKLLPLTWLRIADNVPRTLTLRGGKPVVTDHGLTAVLRQLVPMLPYQRRRRRLVVVCDQRGRHRFGPVDLSSGNPVARQAEHRVVAGTETLLVYPKLFALAPVGPAARVPLGKVRADRRVTGDPSRIMGVRPYQTGDPLRHVEWRATARAGELLVKIFEPTTDLRVAVFADFFVVPRTSRSPDRDVAADAQEFAVAVTASLVWDLLARRVATGIYSTARIRPLTAPPGSATTYDQPLVCAPSGAPGALARMMEQLALADVSLTPPLAAALGVHGPCLGQGCSLVVVASHFPVSTLEVLSDLHRRMPVTTVWVSTGRGDPPPPEVADTAWEVDYRDDWKHRTTLEIFS